MRRRASPRWSFSIVSDNGMTSPSAMPCLDLIAPPSKPPKPGSRKRPVTDHAAQQQHSLPLLNKVTTQQLADQAYQCLPLSGGFCTHHAPDEQASHAGSIRYSCQCSPPLGSIYVSGRLNPGKCSVLPYLGQTM